MEQTDTVQAGIPFLFVRCSIYHFCKFVKNGKQIRHQGILGKEDHRHDADGIRFLLMQKSSLIMGQRFLIR